MDENARCAIVAAYFLSRFPDSYSLLGFENMSAGHRALGERFGLTADAIKNRRDEFDPIHQNGRAGWYQHEMRPSRRLVVEQFQTVGKEALTDLVRGWLSAAAAVTPSLLQLLPPTDDPSDDDGSSGPTARTITGAAAEDHFKRAYSTSPWPIGGSLVDCTAEGCGYDYRIVLDGEIHALVEVKGLADMSGQITFTEKEWRVARENGELYVVALVRDLRNRGTLTLHRNPAKHLKPKTRLVTVVQETWTIGSTPLMKIES